MQLQAPHEKPNMADERTPLIQRVDVRPHRDRYPHHRLRFVCTTVLAAIVLIGGIVAVFLFSFESEKNSVIPWLSTSRIPSGWLQKRGLDFEELQTLLLGTPDAERAREWSRYYTSGTHLAGKNFSQALWTKRQWEQFGIASTIVDYDVWLNYPRGHRLALLEKSDETNEADKTNWKVKYEAELTEHVLKEDETSQLAGLTPTFHAYSASGNVTAPYVFVNYGTIDDYSDLLKANISLKGKIALAKYGRGVRGLKIKRAQELGMVGVAIYSDPGDDGEITEKNGYATYPEGPAREPSSVQRGSVEFISFASGDPTTPGYPSKPGVPRLPVDQAIPSIPSLPISYLDALPLLKALNGHGPKASSLNKYWQQGGLDYKGVEYNIGPTPKDLVLNLVNEQEYVTTPIWNVVGIINGTIPDEVVILGNHRDAWVAGASDATSGSAAFNELIRSFGLAVKAGWKPLRTIVFASWDGEEFGLLGSTEWVEEYLPWLSSSAVAYLNVDVATDGPTFRLSAAPLLSDIVEEALRVVPSPNQTIEGSTVYDQWDKHIATMGSGSDFTSFQDFAGIPSIDMGYGYDAHSAPYHYHSVFDSFHWMEHFCDPTFEYHTTITKIWALVAARLVETPVLPLSAMKYAIELEKYVDTLKEKTKSVGRSGSSFDGEISWDWLDEALSNFGFAAFNHDSLAADLLDQYSHIDEIPWWQPWKRAQLYLAIRKINTKTKLLERQFLFSEGLDGRPWFKHIVFAPGKWTGYAGATFPGIDEGIDENDDKAVFRWILIASNILNAAADWLEE